MQYILNADGDVDHSRYAEYLATIEGSLPPHVLAFASDACHFDLHSPTSLHDAWLESLIARESSSGERHEVRRLEVEVILLGQYHDRRIRLKYFGVTRHLFDVPARQEPRYQHTANGDLLTHEVRLGEQGLLVHELLFERGSRVLIECVDFRHEEEMLNGQQ